MRQSISYTLKFIAFSAFLAIVVLVFGFCGHFSNKSSKTFLSEKEKTGINIIIDAGHGGEDGGAAANGVVEKDLNLSISKYLYQYFLLSPYNVHMTRDTDVLLYKKGEEKHKKKYDITNRIEYAKNFDNAVFISIHQNKFEIPKYKGLQVYYSPNNLLSENLAGIIQSNNKLFIDSDNKRQIKKADKKIRLLDTLEMPAVLVECGFLSNYEEANKLKDSEYQKKIAFNIFISVLQFMEENGDGLL